MRLPIPRDFFYFSFSSALALLLGIFVKSGFWVGVIALPGALAGPIFTLRYFNLASILFIAGTPTLFIYVNNFLEVVPYLRVERAMVIALLGALMLRVFVQKMPIKSVIPIERWMLILMVVCGTAVVLTSAGEPKDVIKNNLVTYVQGLFLPYSAYFIARQQNWLQDQVNRWLYIMMFVGVYLFATGLLQIFLDMHFFYPHYLSPPAVADRASGTFVNPNEYGMVMTTFILLGMLLYIRSRDRLMRVTWIGLMMLFGIGLLLCKTRAPWMAAFFGILFIFAREQRSRALISTGFFIGVLGLLAVLPWLIDSGVLRERVFFLESLYPRLSSYLTAINIIIQNPFVGIGFGPQVFIDAKPEYATTFGLISMQWTRFASVPHNEFLHVLVLTGLIGFIPFVRLLVWFNRLTRPLSNAPGKLGQLRNDFALITRAVFFTYLLNCLLVDVLFFHYFLMLMFFMLGIVVSLDDQLQQHAPTRPVPA